MADKIKTNVYLSPQMLTALKKLAVLRGEPYAALIREACRQYIVANASQIAMDARVMGNQDG